MNTDPLHFLFHEIWRMIKFPALKILIRERGSVVRRSRFHTPLVQWLLERDTYMTNGCPREEAYSRLLPYNFAVSEANGGINAREDFHIAM